MSDRFDIAVDAVLRHEGGFSNHPNDTGGATNYGISIRFLTTTPGVDGDFDGDGDVDAEDIRNMTLEDAKAVYKQAWWDKYKYESINDLTIATKVFDLAVNMGASRAHKLLQTAMNKTFGLKLTVDGVLGPASMGVINSISDGDDEQLLLNAYCDEAWGFYQRIIANNPSQKVFAKGWKNRAYALNRANALNPVGTPCPYCGKL